MLRPRLCAAGRRGRPRLHRSDLASDGPQEGGHLAGDRRHNDRRLLAGQASKWNKIEHRLFCHITQNWRGRPLTDRLAAVELIGATTSNAGLKVESALDTRRYQKGIKVSNAAMKRLDITGDQFHPEWNYTIKPRPP